jgi:Zn finger protein HypA/HybF involved in hydrogenase expression
MMHLKGARWTPKVKFLKVQCDCGRNFEAPTHKALVTCPACKATADTETVRTQKIEL